MVSHSRSPITCGHRAAGTPWPCRSCRARSGPSSAGTGRRRAGRGRTARAGWPPPSADTVPPFADDLGDVRGDVVARRQVNDQERQDRNGDDRKHRQNQPPRHEAHHALTLVRRPSYRPRPVARSHYKWEMDSVGGMCTLAPASPRSLSPEGLEGRADQRCCQPSYLLAYPSMSWASWDSPVGSPSEVSLGILRRLAVWHRYVTRHCPTTQMRECPYIGLPAAPP